MYNLNPEMVEMILLSKDNISYKFKCKVCGQVWWPNIKPKKAGELFGTSDYYQSAWQCPNGCKLEDLERKHYREAIKSES